MTGKLFIPQKIKVGFQNRSDTYTKRLAYVIYYDEKGKLRKETSWEGWRDKTIEPLEIENKPYNGFVLNKGVQRSSDWFGSGRSLIRVYDDRGIEFEVAIDNLMFILMTTDCLKRGLVGEFVYAWKGKDLILLPTDCEEYREAMTYTDYKDNKVSVKELVPGCCYRTKEMNDLIYLGKFPWHTYVYENRNYNSKITKVENMFVFINESTKQLQALKGLTSLALKTTDIPVSNYAELMDVFTKSKFSHKIVDIVFKPLDYDLSEKISKHKRIQIYVKVEDGKYIEYCLFEETKGRYENNKWVYDIVGYALIPYYIVSFYNEAIQKKHVDMHQYQKLTFFKLEEVFKLNIGSLFFKTDNQTEIPIDEY